MVKVEGVDQLLIRNMQHQLGTEHEVACSTTGGLRKDSPERSTPSSGAGTEALIRYTGDHRNRSPILQLKATCFLRFKQIGNSACESVRICNLLEAGVTSR